MVLGCHCCSYSPRGRAQAGALFGPREGGGGQLSGLQPLPSPPPWEETCHGYLLTYVAGCSQWWLRELSGGKEGRADDREREAEQPDGDIQRERSQPSCLPPRLPTCWSSNSSPPSSVLPLLPQKFRCFDALRGRKMRQGEAVGWGAAPPTMCCQARNPEASTQVGHGLAGTAQKHVGLSAATGALQTAGTRYFVPAPAPCSRQPCVCAARNMQQSDS